MNRRTTEALALGARWRACLVALAALTMAATAMAAPQEKPATQCNVKTVKQDLIDLASSSLWDKLTAGLKSSRCSSVISVLTRMSGKKVSAGRKLEPDRPLDVDEAKAEYGDALADPEIKAQIAKETSGVSDADQRTLLEAAVMDEFAMYKARDLLIARLRQGAKP